VVILCGVAMACSKTPPPLDDAGARAALAEARTKDALSDFAGLPPALCIGSSATHELCEWRLLHSASGWASLARWSDTEDALNLLCELPLDGSPRRPGSCSVHSRRSNRQQWIPRPESLSEGEHSMRNKQQIQLAAQAVLDRAETLVALSRLLGAAPERCAPQPGELQLCEWLTTARTYGHGTLATSIGARPRQNVRLWCVLPIDGGARGPDSCRAEIEV
jgi:hypothetical protein